MSDPIKVEVCIDSIQSALASQQGGADRVELCDNLVEGGTTPSAGAIAIVREHLTIGVQVMIRPRGGDFCYSDLEFAIMQRDIDLAKSLGADGVVIGLLKPDGTVDKERSATLIALARPMSVTFHRAFDMTRDPFEALNELIALGVDRILTSGHEDSVLEGLDLITELVAKAGDQVIIMPGAGVTTRNIGKIIAQSKAREVHIAPTTSVNSQMTYRNARPFMGIALKTPEYALTMTDVAGVQACVDVVKG